MVLLTSTEQFDGESDISVTFTVPAFVKQHGTIAITRVSLPDPPFVYAMIDQIESDTGETFDTMDARSLAELATQLTSIRQADGSQLLACYVSGSEFTICTFDNDVTLGDDMEALLHMPQFLPKQMCYSSTIDWKATDQSHAVRIIATGVQVNGLIDNGTHSAILEEFGRGERVQGHTLDFSHHTDSFTLEAKVVKKDGETVSLVARDYEPVTFTVEIV
jgi:hypothetical protein